MQPDSSLPATQQPDSILARFAKFDFGLFLLLIALLLAYLFSILLGNSVFFFELFSHFQVQFLVGSVILVVYFSVTTLLIQQGKLALPVSFLIGRLYMPRATAVLTALMIAVLSRYQVYRVTELKSQLAGANVQSDIRVFHANVLYTRADYLAPITLIQQQKPDLYVLQEMTPASIRHVTGHLKTEFPYWFACWSKGPCWVLVGSRTSIAVDTALARQKRIIVGTTRVRGRAMSLITVHPRTPVLPSWFAERNEQLQLAADKTRDNALPTVLIGDFNISAFSPVYTRIFEWGITLKACRKGFGWQPTWPRFFPPMMIPIDHAFVNSGFRPARFQTLDLPQSDHRAVVADVRFASRHSSETNP